MVQVRTVALGRSVLPATTGHLRSGALIAFSIVFFFFRFSMRQSMCVMFLRAEERHRRRGDVLVAGSTGGGERWQCAQLGTNRGGQVVVCIWTNYIFLACVEPLAGSGGVWAYWYE